MSTKNVQIARFRSRTSDVSGDPPLDAYATRVGHLVAILGDGRIGVAVPGVAQTLAARLAISLTSARLQAAIDSRQGAVIVFEGRSPDRAIVIGLIESVPLDLPGAAAATEAPTARAPAAPRVVEADVDGKRVRIVGNDEIVLECGSASITLRRNGRVIIRGTYVETHSEGTNRIKGAAVQIN